MKLTIGMATYDDFHGVYFTVQALRMYHAEAMAECELLVVDSNPESRHGHDTKNLCANAGVRYVEMPGGSTSTARNKVFQQATGNAVLCTDCHCLFPAGVIRHLLDWWSANSTCDDLLHGPRFDDSLSTEKMANYFADRWRAQMWGIWEHDPRGEDPTGEPFDIPAMGLGVFSARRASWLGFHPEQRGFGGEEFYIHEKYRQAGRRVLCLPWLRWLHRFGRPDGVPYPLLLEDKVRNYMLELKDLGLPMDRLHRHFCGGECECPPEENCKCAESGFVMGLDHWQRIWNSVHNGETPRQRQTLEQAYRKAASTKSDINEHCPKLRELASQCTHVTEFGKRRGVSTVALLAGKPELVVSYDTVDDGTASSLAHLQGVKGFAFVKADVLTCDPIQPTDMLFIDTIHTADQLEAELSRHAGNVRRFIALHDTSIYGINGERGGKGLLVALHDFLRANSNWRVIYHATHNHGLTVISRDKSDWCGPVKIWPCSWGEPHELRERPIPSGVGA